MFSLGFYALKSCRDHVKKLRIMKNLVSFLKTNGVDSKLTGWYTIETTRTSGKSCGNTDTYYFSPENERFRSRIEVLRFLKTGDKYSKSEQFKKIGDCEDDTTNEIDDLCELFEDILYVNDDKFETLKYEDTALKSRNFLTVRKRLQPYILAKLPKCRIKILNEINGVRYSEDTPTTNIVINLEAHARNVVHSFFKIERMCRVCISSTKLQRAHTIRDRPDILRDAIHISRKESGFYESSRIMRKFIELHGKYPIATMCVACHNDFDKKR